MLQKINMPCLESWGEVNGSKTKYQQFWWKLEMLMHSNICFCFPECILLVCMYMQWPTQDSQPALKHCMFHLAGISLTPVPWDPLLVEIRMHFWQISVSQWKIWDQNAYFLGAGSKKPCSLHIQQPLKQPEMLTEHDGPEKLVGKKDKQIGWMMVLC